MVSKYITLRLINPSGQKLLWAHHCKCLLTSTQNEAGHTRYYRTLQQNPTNVSSAVLARGMPENQLGCAHISNESFKKKIQEFYNTKINSDFLFSPQRNLGNSSETRLKHSLLKVLNFRSLLSTPSPFMIYGVSGLIPFVFSPAYMFLNGSFNSTLAQSQLIYGACILSFIGGISWGGELMGASNKVSLSSLNYSILLPLIAWPAVLLYPNSLSFIAMIGGISYAAFKDFQNPKYPIWFVSLRILLSSIVVSALMATLIFYWTKTPDGRHESKKLQEIPISKED